MLASVRYLKLKRIVHIACYPGTRNARDTQITTVLSDFAISIDQEEKTRQFNKSLLVVFA